MSIASVQLVTAPWSGVPWSPGASATGVMGGGAATPVLHGAGFNWASIVGSKNGGPVAAFLPNVRGVPMKVSYARTLRGLGQDASTDVFSGPAYTPPDITSAWWQPTGPDAAPGTLERIIAPLTQAAGAIGRQYMAYQNPLYGKQTVALTPQGQVVFATNQPAGGINPFAGTSLGGGSMLGILLVVGVVVLVIARGRG